MEENTPEKQLEPQSFAFRRVSKDSKCDEKVTIVIQNGICNMGKLGLKTIAMEQMSHFADYITDLNISHNAIEEIPETMFDIFTNLVKLNMSFNRIQWIPRNFGNLVHLKELYAACNKIRYLPLAILVMNHIEILDFWENPLCGGWKHYLTEMERRAGPFGDIHALEKVYSNMFMDDNANPFRADSEENEDLTSKFDEKSKKLKSGPEPIIVIEELEKVGEDENVSSLGKPFGKLLAIARKMKLEQVGGTIVFGLLSWYAYNLFTTSYPDPLIVFEYFLQEYLKTVEIFNSYLNKTLNPWYQENVPAPGYICGILLGIANFLMSDKLRFGLRMLLHW